MFAVDVERSAQLQDFLDLLDPGQAGRFSEAAERIRSLLAGRVVWNLSSTATGGGVAEMLHALLGYAVAAGVDTRWLVIEGDAEFFAITKRVHNALHGAGGLDAVPGPAEHAHYEQVLADNVGPILREISPGDIVIVHDPQPAGLVGALQGAGARVVWRSHIGRDDPTPVSVAGWEFLRRYVTGADAFVFSRKPYAPEWVPAERLAVIPPSIDPLSTKNRPLETGEVLSVLRSAGVLAGGELVPGIHAGAPAPAADVRLVVQVSRWDRLKDMSGVLVGFAGVAAELPDDVHLMLVGPATAGVSDDPEGAQVFAECIAAWRALPPEVASRVHLVSAPMEDPERNALIVNAVQRHAAVVTQKSLVEGFGLTVAEAMWKGRPVIASAVGGIADQIESGVDGLLLLDPTDLGAFGAALRQVLTDLSLAERLGAAAEKKVHQAFLGDRHLLQYADLLTKL